MHRASLEPFKPMLVSPHHQLPPLVTERCAALPLQSTGAAQIILVDNWEQRSRLIENIQRSIDEQIEAVASAICADACGERPLRRLRTLTAMLSSIEVGGRCGTIRHEVTEEALQAQEAEGVGQSAAC